ncbi:MAG: ion transporter [Cyanobacteria bacterium P01_A01_bin.40]
MKRKAFRHKLYHILEAQNYSDWLSRLDQVLLSILIILDISCFILETSQPLNQNYYWLFRGIAIFSTIIFTLEYGLRLWLCTVERQFRHPLWGRIRYALTPMAIIDFISTFPFYLLLVFQHLAVLKTLRVLRLARILKIGRHSKSVRSLVKVIISKQEELLITLSIISWLLIIASSLMFFAEHEAQPEAFSSIPASMWWGVVTLTTVGYGDIYPVTVMGKLLGACLACFGIGVFILPAGIVASSFAQEVRADILPEQLSEKTTKRSVAIQTRAKKSSNQTQLYQQVQSDAQLLKYCLQAAQQEIGSIESDQEAINSWAMFLYLQAKQEIVEDSQLVSKL